jgi:SAM-dependent methyltransferase
MDQRSERVDPRCGYFMRVFGEQWVAPRHPPSMLDLSWDAGLMWPVFTRLGFLVTRVRVGDTSLEELGARLEGLDGRFDVVCCYDLLERLDDWDMALRHIAARLRPGGLFLYSTAGRPSRTPRWLRGVARRARSWTGATSSLAHDQSPTAGDMAVALRAARLLPREIVALTRRADWWRATGTVDAGSRSFAGWAVREADRAATVAPMRWDFHGTGERWLVGRGAAGAPLVARRGAR